MDFKKEDRISTLPDELLHHILSFLHAKLAVEMSILSKRWVNLWRTLSYINFQDSSFLKEKYPHNCDRRKFIPKFLKNRDKNSDTSSIVVDLIWLDKKSIINYAISHNVKHLEISNLCSMRCYLSFPVLETLHLTICTNSIMYWDLPCLTTLYLNRIGIDRHQKPLSFEKFSTLENLTIDTIQWCDVEVVEIKSPNLTSLTISQWADGSTTWVPKFIISAPKLSSFSCFGNYLSVFSCESGGHPCLKDVTFGFDPDSSSSCGNMRELRVMNLTSLLFGFRGAKCLTLSLKTVQVFSSFLESPEFWPSPFGNLKTLHLVDPVPNQTTNLIDSVNHVINYLLNSSPDLKIFVKDCSGEIRSYNPKTDILYKNSCGYCKVKSKGNTSLNKQVANSVQVSGDEPQGVVEVIPPALVPSTVNEHSCTFKKSSLSFGDVHPEYMDLLTCIKEEHPETFDHFAPQTEVLHTLGLISLCSLVKAFYEDSKAGFTVSVITCYRGLFSDLERWGFNTTWLINLLNNADKNLS